MEAKEDSFARLRYESVKNVTALTLLFCNKVSLVVFSLLQV